MLMVKPGLAYLDIVKQVKDKYPSHPLFIYQVNNKICFLYIYTFTFYLSFNLCNIFNFIKIVYSLEDIIVI